MPIRVLDPTVAAQIAAGEVVERPASVAKELIENALDAGATRINVEVRGGGLRELRIQDDGCGIAADEIELAFERHATSKLRSADDLWSLQTLGFRGEALPSIASVAQLICTTRAEHDPVGTELRIAGGEIQSRTPVGCSRGTTFSVRNLFYNVPVRREFLRSEGNEAAAVSTIVTQYALAYPEVRFMLVVDGRMAFQTNGRGDVREVLIELYGLDTGRQLLPVDASFGEDNEAISVRGLVSPPGLTRSSRGYLYVFVNRRAIQPRGQIAAVIEEAYHTLLMKGRHPVAVLDVRVDPASVDVNIHPTKSEVKFRDGSRVMGALSRAVRDALLEQGGVRPWAEASAPTLPVETAQRRFDLRRMGGRDDDGRAGGWQHTPFERPAPPADDWLPQRRASDQDTLFPPEPVASLTTPPDERELFPDPADRLSEPPPPLPAPPLPPASRLPPLRVVGQIGQNYIIAESPDGMFLIDQHAAHERINYERLMRLRGQGAIEQQQLLIPQTVQLTPAAQQTLLEHKEELAEWGYAIEDFGTGLRVRAVPSGARESNLQEALVELAAHLSGQGGSTPLDRREAMLTTLACHSSIRSGQTLSLTEMRELLVQLERCDAPRTCPHGRPTMILLTTTQLERQFGRIK
ncbi:MAG TPA: DNA mismatch repair endonuclease MutL [Roseiflexaceae bacterium]|nr:DNA mismatch repair endonuclease MutL [Roseiflexaceae bacterium]